MRRVAELAETETRLAALPRAGAARDRDVPVDARRPLEVARRRGRASASPSGFASRFTLPRARAHVPHRRCGSRPRSSCTCGCSRRWWASSTRASGARARLRQNAYLQAVHETGRAPHARHQEPAAVALRAHLDGAARSSPTATRACCSASCRSSRSACTPRSRSCARPRWPRSDSPVDARATGGRDVSGGSPAATSRSRRRSTPAPTVPAALFDSFVENCLDNARAKREREPEPRSRCVLRCAARRRASCSVRDTGSAIPEAIVARGCFREPIERARGEGLAIGLYQAARQARAAGYRLELASNRDGEVCFRAQRLTLRRASPAPRRAPSPTARARRRRWRRASRSTAASWPGGAPASGTRASGSGSRAARGRVARRARAQRSKIACANPNHVTSPAAVAW